MLRVAYIWIGKFQLISIFFLYFMIFLHWKKYKICNEKTKKGYF